MLLELAIGLLFLLLVFTIGYALAQFGLFHPVEVKTGPPPTKLSGEEIAFKVDRGPYQKAGHLFTTIHGDLVRLVPEEKLSLLPMVGLYFDDPTTVAPDRCRYAVGVILTADGSSDELKKQLAELDYQFVRLPTIDYVVYSVFPYIASFSIHIAGKRVYPRIRAYIKEHRLCAHPSIEIYQDNNIYFVLPLSKQDHFYLFDDDEDEDGSEYSSDNESRSGSELSFRAGSDRIDRQRRTSRSHSLPQSGSSSRRHSAISGSPSQQDDEIVKSNETTADGPSRHSSTASSFEELTTAEAAAPTGAE